MPPPAPSAPPDNSSSSVSQAAPRAAGCGGSPRSWSTVPRRRRPAPGRQRRPVRPGHGRPAGTAGPIPGQRQPAPDPAAPSSKQRASPWRVSRRGTSGNPSARGSSGERLWRITQVRSADHGVASSRSARTLVRRHSSTAWTTSRVGRSSEDSRARRHQAETAAANSPAPCPRASMWAGVSLPQSRSSRWPARRFSSSRPPNRPARPGTRAVAGPAPWPPTSAPRRTTAARGSARGGPAWKGVAVRNTIRSNFSHSSGCPSSSSSSKSVASSERNRLARRTPSFLAWWASSRTNEGGPPVGRAQPLHVQILTGFVEFVAGFVKPAGGDGATAVGN